MKNYKFNIKDIELNGWKRSGKSYIFGDNSFIYSKSTSSISNFTMDIRLIMNENENEIISIKTKSGCADRFILDMNDLDFYFNNNK